MFFNDGESDVAADGATQTPADETAATEEVAEGSEAPATEDAAV